jgi:hypothetical protein
MMSIVDTFHDKEGRLSKRDEFIERYTVLFMGYWAQEMRLRNINFNMDVSSNIGTMARASAAALWDLRNLLS